MISKLRGLQQRRTKLAASARATLDLVESEGREFLSADETADLDGWKAEIAALDIKIAREIEQIELEKSIGIMPAGTISMGHDRRRLDPKRGFKSLGEFCKSVLAASIGAGRAIDERLTIGAVAPTTFGNEGSGQDGGFTVPPQFAKDIFALTLTDDALLPLTDNIPLEQSNSMVFPKDETTPWGTDGVRAYWQAEVQAGTQTKPKFGTSMLRLHKLMALVPMSDEIVEDSPIGDYIAPLFARSIRWKTNEAILFGTGAGQPDGMFTGAGASGSPAVVQAKDSGQLTNTLSVLNIANMIARLVPGAFGDAVWMMTPDALPLLFAMTLGNYPIYLPVRSSGGGALQVAPSYGTLFGRPLLVSQHAAAFSSQGDLMLVAPKWYRTITKAREDIETDESLHLYFDADATAYRALFRVDGGPKILNPISQAKGGKTLSPFIALAAR